RADELVRYLTDHRLFLLHRIGRTAHQIKKTVLWWAVLSRPDENELPSKPVLRFGGILCVGQIRPSRCLSEAAVTYKAPHISEDKLLKKALPMRGIRILLK
ncbi:MAG: hypothetical protein IJ298_01030, partial [Ruminococcus sp.]|nr:hypothetical protein [Ruminococcus sp.]